MFDWRRYVPVATRKKWASREIETLAKRGVGSSPVVIEGRTIASTFWGKAWCDNLHRYGDYMNRLPRGRSYVRHGAVIDLGVGAGTVEARVLGSTLYDVKIDVAPLDEARWKRLCADCGGAIDSVVELLQGRFAKGVMERLCDREQGMFPAPTELRFSCTCPDWASMCKHVAAALYGVGARLDDAPELFFRLRQVSELDLIAAAGHALVLQTPEQAPEKILAGADLAELFGIELGSASENSATVQKPARRKAKAKRNPKPKKTKAIGRTPTKANEARASGKKKVTARRRRK